VRSGIEGENGNRRAPVLPVMLGMKDSEAYAKYNEAKHLPEVVSEDDCARDVELSD
jgi:hypothetical protein